MSGEYILYDLPSKQDNACWSPNSWKGRAALNFKGVPYKTVWVPYTELQQKFDPSELKPNPEGGWADYTVPIVQFPDSSLVMESNDIVQKLDAVCPSPSLRLDDALQQKAQDVCNQTVFPMVAFIFNRAYSDIITDEEKEWFRKDRETRGSAMMGRDHITLEEWYREAGGKEALFKASEPGMAELSKFLKEHKKDDGPFVLGSEVCYADLIVVSVAEFFHRMGDGAYEKLIDSVDGMKELHEACRPWFERNNY